MSGMIGHERQDCLRGCGWRKNGGLYIVADGLWRDCGKLPIPLAVCPTCSCGIKPSRSLAWVNMQALAGGRKCASPNCSPACPLFAPPQRCGLIWVGERFYPTPAHFMCEAQTQGVSRRIPAIPKGLVPGETLVALAHRKAIANPDGTFTPAIFTAFIPQRIEYVVDAVDSQEKLERLAGRGVTLVTIKRNEGRTLMDVLEESDNA